MSLKQFEFAMTIGEKQRSEGEHQPADKSRLQPQHFRGIHFRHSVDLRLGEALLL